MMDVLFAGTDAEVRTFLEMNLPEWGFRLEATSDGTAALRILRASQTPRVAILQEDLPEDSLMRICQDFQTQADPPNVYVFLIPQKGKEANVRAIMKAGIDYLRRPLTAGDLQIRLKAARRILRLEESLAQTAEGLRLAGSRDPLTGVWNRSAVLDVFRREFGRARREGTPFGLIMIGVDQFRSILDTRGDRAGDAVLRAMARRLPSAVRPYDTLGRCGENEFLAILPGCGQADLPKIASRLRDLFLDELADITDEASQEVDSQPKEERIPVTLSLGVFASDKLSDADTLLRGVRQAFYRAKQEGGNRVVEPTPAEVDPGTSGPLADLAAREVTY